jgi:hypothetical protein
MSVVRNPEMSVTSTHGTGYRDQAVAELDTIPDEYLPYVIRMLRSFHESLTLKPATESFRQGWTEAQRGETYDVASLWEGIDAG